MNKIATYRKQLGLSQRQLAVQLGWIQSRLANYEANFRSAEKLFLPLIGLALIVDLTMYSPQTVSIAKTA